VGILCPNTPAFLESIFGVAAAGSVNVCMCIFRAQYV
jgi:acyl-CoA synthetase (AMP-forming)/AMP-acid ligase II